MPSRILVALTPSRSPRQGRGPTWCSRDSTRPIDHHVEQISRRCIACGEPMSPWMFDHQASSRGCQAQRAVSGSCLPAQRHSPHGSNDIGYLCRPSSELGDAALGCHEPQIAESCRLSFRLSTRSLVLTSLFRRDARYCSTDASMVEEQCTNLVARPGSLRCQS